MSNSGSTTISIAKNFSVVPAGRTQEDGDYSGLKFRKEYLVPALKTYNLVHVEFDGVAGLGSSFLEEAFGGLVREEGMDQQFLNEHLHIYTNDEGLQDFVEMAQFYIKKEVSANQAA